MKKVSKTHLFFVVLTGIQRRRVWVVAVTVFATVGMVLLAHSFAVTPVSNIEAETGTVSSSMSVVNDSTASGGKAVRFGGGGSGTNYYVNCSTGSDSNDGTIAAPWKSAAKISSVTFSAGDTIYLSAGCSFDGGMTLKGSGTSTEPITLSSYGSGAAPIVSYTNGAQYSNALTVTGSYMTIQNILVKNGNQYGILVSGDHNIIKYTEIEDSGIAVDFTGQYNLATHDYAHDLHMIVDTPGGDDDYGAVGYDIMADNNEVSYSKCVNCKAPSDDYGYDGGFVEIWRHADNLYVHDNWAENTEGFMEVGGADPSTDHANNVRVAYNVLYNTGGALVAHTTGQYAISVNNFRFENNTFYQPSGTGNLFFQLSPGIIVRNNIFYSVDSYQAGSMPGTHTNNLYYLGGSGPGYTLDSGEKTADPLFVNASAKDFHLQSDSPARSMGATGLGYQSDYDGNPVNSPPDVGAFQFQ